jgi:hypothetical protein
LAVAKLRDKRERQSIERWEPDPNFKPDPNSPVDPLIQEIAATLSIEDLLGVEGAAKWEEWKNTPVDPAEHKKYLERSEERWSKVPPEAWDDVPSDFSVNLDHYLYGTPKRTEE